MKDPSSGEARRFPLETVAQSPQKPWTPVAATCHAQNIDGLSSGASELASMLAKLRQIWTAYLTIFPRSQETRKPEIGELQGKIGRSGANHASRLQHHTYDFFWKLSVRRADTSRLSAQLSVVFEVFVNIYPSAYTSHFCFQSFLELLKFVHVCLLCWPRDSHSLFSAWLRNHMEVYL